MMQMCGFNSFGQIGSLISEIRNPEHVSVCRFERAVKIKNVKFITFAWNHAIIVEEEGNLWKSGFVGDKPGQLLQIEHLPFHGVDIKQVACSRDKLFVVTTDGQLWEQNYSNKVWRNLKNLLPLTNCKFPVAGKFMISGNEVAGNEKINHSASDSFGEGEGGHLLLSFSLNLPKDTRKPRVSTEIENYVEGLDVEIRKVSVGNTFVGTLTEDGRAFILPHEQLVVPPELGPIVDLACGHEHGILLTSQGHVLTWGTALRGQLGNDSVDTCPQPAEVLGLAGLKFVAIAAGGWHSCAVSRDGDLYVWGWNKFGQLGFPTNQDNAETTISVAYIPMVVDWPLEDSANILEVHCGSDHTIVKCKNGELWGCGWNKYGQLGLGYAECVPLMTRLFTPTDGTNVRAVVCGAWNSAIIFEKNSDLIKEDKKLASC